MLRMVNLLMALSLGVHREQLEHRIGLTWPYIDVKIANNIVLGGFD